MSELASEVDVEILAEDTIEALGAKLALHSDSLESYVTQIHQLRFDTDELTKRHLKTQAAAARADVELQLAVDEFDRLQHKRIQMQRTSRCLTRAVAVPGDILKFYRLFLVVCRPVTRSCWIFDGDTSAAVRQSTQGPIKRVILSCAIVLDVPP